MRVLVTGSRRVDDPKVVHDALDRLSKTYSFDALIEGDAGGVDRLAGYWARRKGIENIKFPADWDDITRAGAVIRINQFGKPYDVVAGFRRNEAMFSIGEPDMVIAFNGGAGTADCVARAQAHGIPIIFVDCPLIRPK